MRARITITTVSIDIPCRSAHYRFPHNNILGSTGEWLFFALKLCVAWKLHALSNRLQTTAVKTDSLHLHIALTMEDDFVGLCVHRHPASQSRCKLFQFMNGFNYAIRMQTQMLCYC